MSAEKKKVINKRVVEVINQLIELKTFKSQSYAARELQLSAAALNHIMKGRNMVSLDLLEQLISQFNVNPYWIFMGQEPMVMDGQARNEGASDKISTEAVETRQLLMVLSKSIEFNKLKEKLFQLEIEHRNLRSEIIELKEKCA